MSQIPSYLTDAIDAIVQHLKHFKFQRVIINADAEATFLTLNEQHIRLRLHEIFLHTANHSFEVTAEKYQITVEEAKAVKVFGMDMIIQGQFILLAQKDKKRERR